MYKLFSLIICFIFFKIRAVLHFFFLLSANVFYLLFCFPSFLNPKMFLQQSLILLFCVSLINFLLSQSCYIKMSSIILRWTKKNVYDNRLKSKISMPPISENFQYFFSYIMYGWKIKCTDPSKRNKENETMWN